MYTYMHTTKQSPEWVDTIVHIWAKHLQVVGWSVYAYGDVCMYACNGDVCCMRSMRGRLCMYACVHESMCVRVYVCRYVYTYVCMRAYNNILFFLFLQDLWCVCVIFSPKLRMCVHIYIHICVCLYMWACPTRVVPPQLHCIGCAFSLSLWTFAKSIESMNSSSYRTSWYSYLLSMYSSSYLTSLCSYVVSMYSRNYLVSLYLVVCSILKRLRITNSGDLYVYIIPATIHGLYALTSTT